MSMPPRSRHGGRRSRIRHRRRLRRRHWASPSSRMVSCSIRRRRAASGAMLASCGSSSGMGGRCRSPHEERAAGPRARASEPRPLLPLPRLHAASLPARAPRRPLGARRPERALEPRPSVPLPPQARARSRIHARTCGAGRGASLPAPDGRVLPPVPELGRSDPSELPRGNRGQGVEVGPETCASGWTGERLDLPLAIDTLVVRDSRLA